MTSSAEGEEAVDGEQSALQLLVDDLRNKLEEGCPQGWSHALDESGYSYFVQDASGETTWSFPPVAPAAGGAGTADGSESERVAALEAQIARLEKQEKKRAADQKKVALRETAMKTDISKMKAETRQAKKELGEATRAAEARCRAAEEATARAEMELEDVGTHLVYERVEMLQKAVRAVRERDADLAESCFRRLRLGEDPVVPDVVRTGVQEAIDEFDAHEELVARLRTEIRDLSADLAFEKQERQRENDEWRELVRQRDEEISELKGTLAERDSFVAELQQYIAETEERNRIEIERARQFDQNKIAALEAELELSKTRFEETMQELAEIWPDGVPPPSLLRKYVLPIRHREAAARQEKAQEAVRIGSRVQAWNELSASYELATVTAVDPESAHAEVRWAEGSELPPVWLALAYCIAVVEEDMFKQKTQGTQTDLARYDDMLQRPAKPKRPRSASGRMDGRLEAADRRATLALRQRLAEASEPPEDAALRSAARRLFKLIDSSNQGEITLLKVWMAILEAPMVHDFLKITEALQPLRRKEYLVLSWKEVDAEDDLSMPFDAEQFCDVCFAARKLSLRPPELRSAQTPHAVVAREISAAIQRLILAQHEDTEEDDDDDEDEDEDEEEDDDDVEDEDENDDDDDGDEDDEVEDGDLDEATSAESSSSASEVLESGSKSQLIESETSNPAEDPASSDSASQESSPQESSASDQEEVESLKEDPEVRELRSMQATPADVVQPFFSAAQRAEMSRVTAAAVTREGALAQLQDLCAHEADEVRNGSEKAAETLTAAEEDLRAATDQRDAALRGLDATIEAVRTKFTAGDAKASLTTQVTSQRWESICAGGGEDAQLQMAPPAEDIDDGLQEEANDGTSESAKDGASDEAHDAAGDGDNTPPVKSPRTMLFNDQEAFQTADGEESSFAVGAGAQSLAPRRKIEWGLINAQIEKQQNALAEVELKRSQDLASQVAAYEQHAARTRNLENESETLKKELAATEDANLKQGLESKLEMLSAKINEYKAGLNPLARSKDEAKAAHERSKEAKLEFETTAVELEALLEDAQMWEAELDTKSTLVAECTAAADRARSQHEFWVEEVRLLGIRSKQQREILDAMQEIKSKLDAEAERNSAALLRNVEHQEVLRARLEHAKVQMNLAENEIDIAVAQNHLIFLEKEVIEGLAWAKDQWASEMVLVDQNLAERARHLQDDCFRLRAAHEAVAERAALRRLVAGDDKVTNETAAGEDKETSREGHLVLRPDIDRLHALRDLAKQREEAWVLENVRIVRGLAGSWIADQEKTRLRSEVDLTLRESQHKVAQYAEIAMTSQKRFDVLHSRIRAAERRFAAREAAYVAELETLAQTSAASIDILHAELDEQKRRNDEIERIAIEHLKMTEEDYLAMRVHLEERVANLEETLVTNRHWIGTLQADLRDLREQMRIFEEERAREERRLAAEKDQLRQELEAMTQHGARLDNWVNSLKNEVAMLQDTVAFGEQEARRVAAAHAQELRWLRWETWKRDETARTLSTNVDACFLFFIETVARLAGTSRHHNERLAANAGIEVLHALVDSQRPEVARLALGALSAAAWDGHVDVRAQSRLATESWKAWVRGITVVATLRWNRERAQGHHPNFDDSAPEDVGVQLPVQGTTVRLAKDGRVLEIVPTAVAEAECGMNLPNQQRIGQGLSGKRLGVDAFIAQLDSADASMVEKATSTLALLALEAEYRDRVGSALPALLRLVTAGWDLPAEAQADVVPEDSDSDGDGSARDQVRGTAPADPIGPNAQDALEADETRRFALSAICNLLYEHEENQAKFAQVLGVRPMLHICSTSTNVDLLESCTLVLVNATSSSQRVAEQLSENDGLGILVRLCSLREVAVADGDVAERVQANVVQALMNATRDLGGYQVSRDARRKIVAFGVEPLLNLMLTPSSEVQTSAASIIGNLAQDDAMREQMGNDGAVESLFTLCESKHPGVRSAALAALSNLAWNAANQNRIGRLLPQLIALCVDAHVEVREHASGALANALFYHEGNRRRFGLFTKSARTCVGLLADKAQTSKVHENIARALGTAAYNDAVAMQAGLLGAIPSLLQLCGGARGATQRTAAFALTNLAVHDVHKTVILRHGGVEIMTSLCASDCLETARHASRVLEVMADMSRAEELEARRERFGVQGLVDLLKGEEQYEGQANLLQGLSSVQVLACEQIAAEAALPQEAKRRDIVKHEGHKALIALVRAAAAGPGTDVLAMQVAQRALWALRVLMQFGGVFYQDLCGAHELHEAALGALEAFVDAAAGTSAAAAATTGAHGDGAELKLVTPRDVCEGAVGTLFVFCYQHERNSRRVLQGGLKVLINIAENFPAADPLSELTRRLLRIMGPFSWIRCANCASKQKGGRTCSGCGRALANVFIE